jgi:hypothetical protein
MAMDRIERFLMGVTILGMVCLCAAFTLWMMSEYWTGFFQTPPNHGLRHFYATEIYLC